MWEHSVVKVIEEWKEGIGYITIQPEDLQEKLDEASTNGWELISVVGNITEGSYASHTDGFYLFFKRPVEDYEEEEEE